MAKLIFNKNTTKLEPYNVSITPEKITRMHANESSKPILDYNILIKNIDENLNFYPENKALKLIELAGNFYNINKDKIIATNGSDEAIDLMIRTFCNPAEDAILVVEPTFSMYKQYAVAFGLKVQHVELKEGDVSWNFDENELIKITKEKKIKKNKIKKQ